MDENKNGFNNIDDEDDFEIIVNRYSSIKKTDDGLSKTTQAENEDYDDEYDEEFEEDFDEEILNSDDDKNKNISPKLKKILYGLLAFVLVVCIAFGIYAFAMPSDVILNGVSVSGVDLGGMTVDEATEKLNKSDIEDKHEIKLVANGKEFTISPDEIDTKINLKMTAQKAYDFSNSDSKIVNAFNSLRYLFNNNDIAPAVTFDREKLLAKLNEIGIDATGGVYVAHSVREDESGKAFVVPGKTGYSNNPESVLESIIDSLEGISNDPIKVSFQTESPKQLTIEELEALVNKEPADAKYVLENGNVIVQKEQVGRKINKDECTSLLSKIVEGGPEIEIPYSKTDPKITAETLKAKLFNGKLADYTTRFNAGQENRSSNIRNAASKLDGHIIMPDEVMSFNAVVGKRSIANGFKTAPEYQNGQTVDGIGGGTCQVSTTLYSAALYSDLKIEARSNHSMAVSYVPLGQDATVTDGGRDLKIRNNTGYPIKITATTNGGSITVGFIGTTPDVKKTVKIIHSKSMNGTTTVINSVRKVFDENGNEIRSESIGTSKYKPHGSSDSSGNQSSAPSEKTNNNTKNNSKQETAPANGAAESQPKAEEPKKQEQKQESSEPATEKQSVPVKEE